MDLSLAAANLISPPVLFFALGLAPSAASRSIAAASPAFAAS